MIDLFKRRPKLFWKPRLGEQIVSPKAQAQYPALKNDFDILEQQLMSNFRNLDNQALQAQNQFRLQQFILIVGGVLTSAFGAVQAALSGKARWPGVTEAIIAIALTAVSFIAQQTKSQKKYFSSRLKAERLRGEYFLFLGRMGGYKDDSNRVQNLILRVSEIEQEGA